MPLEKIYNLKLKYSYGGVSPANSRYCKIEKVNANTWHYKFEDAMFPWTKWDWNEPVLRVEELIDPRSGELTHLKFTIDAWDGMALGDIAWGSNELPVWSREELEYPPSKNIGKWRVIWIGQIEDPIVMGEIPEPEEKTLWDKLPWYIKGAVIGTPILFITIYAWSQGRK